MSGTAKFQWVTIVTTLAGVASVVVLCILKVPDLAAAVGAITTVIAAAQRQAYYRLPTPPPEPDPDPVIDVYENSQERPTDPDLRARRSAL